MCIFVCSISDDINNVTSVVWKAESKDNSVKAGESNICILSSDGEDIGPSKKSR